MKITKISSKMQGESWRYQWQLRCHAKERSPKPASGKPGKKPKHLKQRFSCIAEAHESTRQRIESVMKRIHEEHIAGKGENSLLHYNLVHKFIPMRHAMKIPDAKAAVDKEWEKVETLPAWQLEKVKSKKEVIKEAQKNNNKVHFASLMDLCHLKNSELEPQFQKYKRKGCASRRHCERRLWSLCSIYSSASQMTAAKVMGVIARLPDCD